MWKQRYEDQGKTLSPHREGSTHPRASPTIWRSQILANNTTGGVTAISIAWRWVRVARIYCIWTSRRPLHISRLKVRNVKLFKFWEVREVEHLAVENRDFSCNPRFSNVLTKLQVQGEIRHEKKPWKAPVPRQSPTHIGQGKLLITIPPHIAAR